MFESIQRYRDYYAGAPLILIGLSTIYQSSRYEVGTLAEIGPGFFPMAMGVILAGCGLAIAFNQSTAADEEHDAETLGRPEWRGWGCILGGVLAFILLAHAGKHADDVAHEHANQTCQKIVWLKRESWRRYRSCCR